jgi:membrane-associated phospholipid phosphatase
MGPLKSTTRVMSSSPFGIGIKRWFPLLSPKMVLAALLFMVALFLFIFLVHEIFQEKEYLFDTQFIAIVAQYRSPGFMKAMQAFSFFGSSAFLLPAYIALTAYFLIKRRRGYSINIALMGIGSTILLNALKLIFHRHRPGPALLFNLHTYSFPSGHSVSSIIFVSVLCWLLWRTGRPVIFKWLLSALLFLFAVTVGFSRIALGVHYPSDVLAGILLGISWVAAVWWWMLYLAGKGSSIKSNGPHAA